MIPRLTAQPQSGSSKPCGTRGESIRSFKPTPLRGAAYFSVKLLQLLTFERRALRGARRRLEQQLEQSRCPGWRTLLPSEWLLLHAQQRRVLSDGAMESDWRGEADWPKGRRGGTRGRNLDQSVHRNQLTQQLRAW